MLEVFRPVLLPQHLDRVLDMILLVLITDRFRSACFDATKKTDSVPEGTTIMVGCLPD